MEIKETQILEMTKDWDENEISHLMRMMNLRRDKITRVWDYVFGKTPTFYERDRTTKWIEEFGYDKVKLGFSAAGDSGISENKCIRYIDKVIRNLHQDEAIKKEKALQAEKLKEVSIMSGEKIRPKTDMQPNKWVGFARNTLGEKE